MRMLISCALVLSLLLFPQSQLFAQEAKVEVQVDHVANVIDKLKEKVKLFFKFSPEAKFEYQKFLLEKRLAELKYVIESDNWDPIEETSSRYTTYLGRFNEFVLSNNSLENKKEEVLGIYQRHDKVLEGLQKNFEFESGWWLLLQHSINSTKIFSGQINESVH